MWGRPGGRALVWTGAGASTATALPHGQRRTSVSVKGEGGAEGEEMGLFLHSPTHIPHHKDPSDSGMITGT